MNPSAHRRLVIVVSVGAVVLALILVALLTVLWAGGSSGRDATAAAQHADSASAAPTGVDDGADTTTTPASSGTGSDQAPRYSHDLFQSPTGNIHCQIGGVFSGHFGGTSDLGAACTAWEYDGTEKSPECSSAGVTSRAGAAALTSDGRAVRGMCAGGQPFDYGTASPADIPVLAYGQSTSNGQVTCTSRESGMDCADLAGGGQFVISRSTVSLGH